MKSLLSIFSALLTGAVLFAAGLFVQPTQAADSISVPAVAAAMSGESEPRDLTVVLDQAMELGERLLGNRDYAEAARVFGLAANLAHETGVLDDLRYAEFRQGDAFWAMYRGQGDLAFARAAIQHWEAELALFPGSGLPPVFEAWTRHDLGRAYLTLAQFEDAQGNTERAIAVLQGAVPTLGGEAAFAVQHILHSRATGMHATP